MANYGLMPSLSGYGVKAPQSYDFGYNPTFESPELYNYAPVRDAVAVPTTIMDQFGGAMSGFNKNLQDWGVTGGKDAQGNTFNGWGGMAVDLFKSLSGFLDGRDRYDLAKKSLAFEKQKYATDTYNQATGINSQLAARNDRRVAEGLMPTMSTADYMAKYGMKTA